MFGWWAAARVMDSNMGRLSENMRQRELSEAKTESSRGLIWRAKQAARSERFIDAAGKMPANRRQGCRRSRLACGGSDVSSFSVALHDHQRDVVGRGCALAKLRERGFDPIANTAR